MNEQKKDTSSSAPRRQTLWRLFYFLLVLLLIEASVLIFFGEALVGEAIAKAFGKWYTKCMSTEKNDAPDRLTNSEISKLYEPLPDVQGYIIHRKEPEHTRFGFSKESK